MFTKDPYYYYYYNYYFTLLRVFHTSVSWWFFTRIWVTTSLLKSPLLFLADVNNAVVWMISTRLFISKSSSPCTNRLVTVPSAIITTGITVTLLFHSFFCSLIACLFWRFFQFYPVVSRNGKVHYSASSLIFCRFFVCLIVLFI